MRIRTKRAYEAASPSDGTRILVDRIWPRGVSRENARIDDWPKEIAPSAALRKWFGHDPDRWDEFRRRYAAELNEHRDLVEDLLTRAAANALTLVYGAKDTEHNNAVALKDYLEKASRAD